MSQSAIPHRTALAQYPMATLALFFAFGIIIARVSAASLPILVASGGASSILLIYFLAKREQHTASLFLWLSFLFLGAGFASIEEKSIAPDRVRRLYEAGVVASGDPVEVTGVLSRAPEPAPDGLYLTLKVEKIRATNQERVASGHLSLFASMRGDQTRKAYEVLELRYGARISVMTTLTRADGFRNPGVSSFKDFLDQHGIDATGTIKSPLLIERLNDEEVFLPLASLYEWRQDLLSNINRTFSPETAGVLAAALLGNRYYLSHGDSERFREGGTFHVLVISGLHISFIGLVTLIVMQRFTSRREWQFAVTVLLLWSYTIAVGAESSVVRAALMFTLVALAPVLGRRSNSFNAIGGAGIALLIRQPGDLYNPSFQLTFLSVVAIVAVAVPLLSRMQEVGNWRPTHETPWPPHSPGWWRTLCESIYWSERRWQEEMKDSPWRCRLFKSRLALQLERFRMQRPLRYVVGAILVSAVVQLVLLPFLVIYFHRVSMASLLLNIFVGILMALLSFCALAAMAAAVISSSVAGLLVTITESINWLMIHSVDPFAAMRVSSVRLPEYSGWASGIYGLYYVPIIVLTFRLARWKPVRHPAAPETRVVTPLVTRMATIALLISVHIIVWHPFSVPKPDGRLHIDFLDVGQGDAALVTMPDGTTVLVDGGGKPSFENSRPSTSTMKNEDDNAEPIERDRRGVGEAVVSEYLWWRGLDRVDYIVVTHADADHIDGLNDIVRNFKTRSALVAREPLKDPEYARFASTLQRTGVPRQLVARGDSMRFGGVIMDVLWPVRLGNTNAPSANDDSIVLRLRYGERTFLLTGDIERKAETTLSSSPIELKCDVVKVAHHGSRSSSIDDFVNATRPALAVISVGLFSAYGHPHRDVIDRWRTNGAEVMTTGASGMISVSTDGRDLKIGTFVTK